jgi:hypothetical protein
LSTFVNNSNWKPAIADIEELAAAFRETQNFGVARGEVAVSDAGVVQEPTVAEYL